MLNLWKRLKKHFSWRIVFLWFDHKRLISSSCRMWNHKSSFYEICPEVFYNQIFTSSWKTLLKDAHKKNFLWFFFFFSLILTENFFFQLGFHKFSWKRRIREKNMKSVFSLGFMWRKNLKNVFVKLSLTASHMKLNKLKHRAHERVDLMMAPDGESENMRGTWVHQRGTCVCGDETNTSGCCSLGSFFQFGSAPCDSACTQRMVTHTHSWLNAAGVFSPVSSTCITHTHTHTHTHTGTWRCVGCRIFSFRFIRGLFEVSGGLWL